MSAVINNPKKTTKRRKTRTRAPRPSAERQSKDTSGETDEMRPTSSDNSQSVHDKSAKLEENNKKAELIDMPTLSGKPKTNFKPRRLSLVGIYMDRIGSVLKWWLIATLVISLAVTIIT